MAKRLSLNAQLARIKELADESVTDSVRAEFKAFLKSKNNVVVSKTAKVIGRLHLSDLGPELETSFNRFMDNPVKSDPACLAKTAIAEVLYGLNIQADELFLVGIKHIQREPVYGGSSDTAAKLRGVCARALASMNYPTIHFLVTNLLADSELQARMDAVNVLAFLADRESELLLRLKVLSGDLEPDVTGLCFSGLMQINPERSVEFVGNYLANNETALATEAAMALGESRSIKAFDILKHFYTDTFFPKTKKMLILPISLIRREEAFAFLLEQLTHESVDLSLEILDGLKLFGLDPSKTEEIERIIINRNIPELSQALNSIKASY